MNNQSSTENNSEIELTDIELIVAYDALCGWTYAANPLMEALANYAEKRQVGFSLVPVGLWVGPTTMDYTPDRVEFFWNSDQRITQLSGMEISEAYRNNILAGDDTRVDSWASVLGAALLIQRDESKHLDYLLALQRGKYVTGLDTAKIDVVCAILNDLGVDVSTADFDNAGVQQQAHELMRRGQGLMRGVGGQGAPTFILRSGQHYSYLDHQPFYGHPAQFVEAVDKVVQSIAASGKTVS